MSFDRRQSASMTEPFQDHKCNLYCSVQKMILSHDKFNGYSAHIRLYSYVYTVMYIRYILNCNI